ncbi:MAG TPA: hypothetical protein VLI94_05330 [Solirubrobacterales bacterium]|nr:hypothetical protein [Solirubrobacterales bacterium]
MATKVGTAYVDVVANFKPLNMQVRQLNGLSAKVGANFRRSMARVSRDAAAARRPVATLSREISGIGAASRASGRQTLSALRQTEAAYARNLKAVRRLEAAQRSLASVRPAPPVVIGTGGARGPAGRGPGPRSAARFDPLGAAAEIGLGATIGGVARPLAKSFGTQYKIVRAVSPALSRVAASKLAVGTMAQAGKFGAQALMGGFTRAIPAAGAAYGVGRTLQAAVEGDLESAAYRAGGTAAGAGVGAGIGTLIAPGPGTVLGGLIGAGLGESGGEILDSIFGGGESGNDKAARLGAEFAERWGDSLEKAARGKNLKKLRNRRAILRSNLVEAKDSGADDKALAPMRKAVRATEARIGQIAVPRKAVDRNMGLMKAGLITRMKDINRMFRTNMAGINQGWNRGTKQWRNATAKNMHATVRSIQSGMKNGLISTEVGQRRIKQLHRKIRFVQGRDPYKIADGFKSSWKRAGEINNKQIAGMIREMEMMPKGARAQAQASMIEMARGLEKGGKISKGSASRLQSALVTTFGNTNKKIARNSSSLGSQVGGTFRNLAGSVMGALGNIGDNVNSALSAFKVGIVNFPLEAPPSGGGQRRQGAQRGGFIVPGRGEGDSFSTTLDSGSFVLNKKATKAFGFQVGGRVPVMLEPGERVFAPGEVRRHGIGTLHALNDSVPRFAKGGRVPDQRLGGPDGPLRRAGQHALNRVDSAAEKWVKKHSFPARVGRMLRFANRESAKGYSYVYGGGHGQLGVGPYDCSGFVSAILGAGGFLSTPMAVAQGTGLYVLGESGPGKFFTWGVRGSSGENAHTMMAIKGPAGRWNYFEAGGGGGAGRRSGWNGAFSFRHMPGFQRGGAVGMPRRAQEKIARHGQEAMNPESPHFVGWGYRGGGLVQRLSGGGGSGIKGPWAGTSIDKTFPANDGYSGATLPGYVIKALAEWAGLPGVTMWQITKGESNQRPGMDISDPPGRGIGLWAINTHWNKHSSEYLRNPILNAIEAKKTADENGLHSGTWHGDKYVTGWGLHYDGDPLAIARHLGGPGKGGKAGGGEKVPKSVSGKYGKPIGKAGRRRHYEARTKRLSFGPLPKEVERCEAELKGLEHKDGMLAEYRAAARQAKGATRAALEANVRAIEDRIRALRKQIRTLRLKKAAKRLGERQRKITIEGHGIEEAQRAYEKASQDAEQTVEHEPEEPGTISLDWVDKVLTPHIKGKEEPAFRHVLGTELTWRNRIVQAQTKVGDFERHWDKKVSELKNPLIPDLEKEIGRDNERIKKLKGLIKEHPKAEKRDQWAQEIDQLARALPAKHDRLTGMRARKKQLNEALAEAKESWDPWRGTGSFEDSMIQVQGIQWPGLHERLDSLPDKPAERSFGGAIRETQRQIQDLDLKIGQARETASQNQSESDAERAELAEQIAREEVQRRATLEAQRPVLEGWDKLRQGVFAGLPRFHTGGQVPGPPQREVPIMARGGELVLTPEQMQAMADVGGRDGSSMVIEQLVVHPDGRATVKTGSRSFDADVKRVVRGMQGTGRRVPGVFSTRP